MLGEKIRVGLVILRMEDPGVLQVAQDSLVRDFERETPQSHCRFLYSMWERPWVKQFTHPVSGRCNLELFSRGGGVKMKDWGVAVFKGRLIREYISPALKKEIGSS